MEEIQKLKKRLEKVEKELDTCRTSVLQDGWQTQRYAKKARKWDYYAQEKMKLIQQIDDYEKRNKQIKSSSLSTSRKQSRIF